jgi:hypothetical protein
MQRLVCYREIGCVIVYDCKSATERRLIYQEVDFVFDFCLDFYFEYAQ